MGNQCPNGYTECDGVCYQKCPSGYQNNCEKCISVCPLGWTDDGDYCLKPPDSDYSNIKFSNDIDCANVAGNCFKCGNNYLPDCLPGYQPIDCNKCTLICPDGVTSSGDKCMKKKYDNLNAIQASLSTSTIFIIISMIIIAIIIFYTAVYSNKDQNSDNVFDIEYGTPGINDTYALISGEKADLRLYTV